MQHFATLLGKVRDWFSGPHVVISLYMIISYDSDESRFSVQHSTKVLHLPSPTLSFRRNINGTNAFRRIYASLPAKHVVIVLCRQPDPGRDPCFMLPEPSTR